jgi:type II secretory pathway pseudopilin PulG
MVATMIKIWSKIMRKKVAMNISESGLSIIEIIISLAIASIIGICILLVLSTNYRVRQQDRILTSKLIDAAIMKQALNKSATMAGAIVTPSALSVSANLTTFLGYNTWGNTSNSGANTNLSSVSLPTQPISVTASNVSFDWVSDNGGGQELCQGTLLISGDVMRYIINSQNLSGGSSTCTSNGHRTAEADFLIGTRWSFQPTLQVGTSCLGPAFNGQIADALVAVKSPMAGTSATSSTASTQVSVCLPNWNQ